MNAVVKHFLVWLFAMAFLASSVAQAQTPPPPFKTEELEQLAAPIALYPDELLTQIMMASTYPLEVVQAARWMESRKKQKPEQTLAEAEKQPWDPSVQALTAFPEVLDMMNNKLDWTQKLGDAVLAQQKDFMDAVQRLRRQAEAAGNLKSSEQIKVVKETETIIIQPANPEVVYVPQYNPTVVYGAWPYPAYPPYYYPSPYYPPGYALGAGIAFGVGVAIVGGAWNNHYHNYHSDWHGGNINVNRNTNINVNNTNINRNAGGNKWEHNPSHRQGVNYRDAGSQQRYGKDVPGAGGREQYRGRDTGSLQSGARDRSGADRAATQDRTGQSNRAGAQAQDRAGQFNQGGDRSQSMNRTSAGEARSFQGVGEGSKAQQSFDRGKTSNQSMTSHRSSSGSMGSGGASSGGRSGGGFGGGGRSGGGGRR